MRDQSERAFDSTDLDNSPFEIWVEAIRYDKQNEINESKIQFQKAAKSFFDSAEKYPLAAQAFYEYSTLMDGFVSVQTCRDLFGKENFEDALKEITKAGEIFRSTLHFAYMSPFVAACASLEVLGGLDHQDAARLESCKNSISLFEQSKLILSFQDDRHPLIELIDAYLRLAISKALESESNLAEESNARDKANRSRLLREEYEERLTKIGRVSESLEYFPLSDYRRALFGAFVIGYPDPENLSLVNVGSAVARVTNVGGLKFDDKIDPKSKMRISLKKFGKMKVRMVYEDSRNHETYEEGCLSLI